jgi:hypothetical protein
VEGTTQRRIGHNRWRWQAGRVLIEHRGAVPEVDPTAYVAPTAVICGAVRIGPGARVLFGAVLTAEDGLVRRPPRRPRRRLFRRAVMTG